MKRNLSQRVRILALLMKKGHATNGELNKIAFRYGAYICDFRKEGFNITSVQGKRGLWTYHLDI